MHVVKCVYVWNLISSFEALKSLNYSHVITKYAIICNQVIVSVMHFVFKYQF